MLVMRGLVKFLTNSRIIERYSSLVVCRKQCGSTDIITQIQVKRITNNNPRKYVSVSNHECIHNQVREFMVSRVLYDEIKEVLAPEFPESVAEGDVRWNKKVGDSVVTDEVVCEIETDKTAIPVPSPANGVIVEIVTKDGQSVKSKQKLFRMKLGPAQAKAATPTVQKQPPAKPTQPAAQPTPQPQPSQAPPQPAAEKSSPQKPIPPRMEPLKITAPSAEGTYLKVPPQDPTKEISGTRSEFRVKMSRMRQRIAQRLKDAQNTCAMITTFNEVDMSGIMAFRKAHQDSFTKKYGIKLGFMSAFLRACVYALQDQPVINAVIIDNEIIYRDYIDISVAIATPKGLLVPVIRNVEKMNYADIEKAIVILGEKGKKGQIAVEDMDGGTFTVSNGGVFGSLISTPIINPPQSAILGMHGVFNRPVAVNNQVVIRPMMYVALSYDHRLVDGREAVVFLRKIKDAVENPVIILAGV